MQNREIKFRGKRVDNGEWVYGYYWKDTISEKTFILTGLYENKKYSELPIIEQIEVDPKTVGQYTGLKDNTIWSDLTKEEKDKWQENNGINSWKGKEIYEGDIIKIFFKMAIRNPENIAEITFKESSFRTNIVGKGEPSIDILDKELNTFEILGNTCENPELLK